MVRESLLEALGNLGKEARILADLSGLAGRTFERGMDMIPVIVEVGGLLSLHIGDLVREHQDSSGQVVDRVRQRSDRVPDVAPLAGLVGAGAGGLGFVSCTHDSSSSVGGSPAVTGDGGSSRSEPTEGEPLTVEELRRRVGEYALAMCFVELNCGDRDVLQFLEDKSDAAEKRLAALSNQGVA